MQTADGSLFKIVPTEHGEWPDPQWESYDIWAWDAASGTSLWQSPVYAERPEVTVDGGVGFVITGHGTDPFQLWEFDLRTGETVQSAQITGPSTQSSFLGDAATIEEVKSGWAFGWSISLSKNTTPQFAVNAASGDVQSFGDTKSLFLEFGSSVVYTDGGHVLTARALDGSLTPLWSIPLSDDQRARGVGDHLALITGWATLEIL